MKTLLIAAHSQTQQLLSEALKRRQHEVTVAEDAGAACTALRSGAYPMIILEADPPQAEGVPLCSRLRAISQGRRCVILAAGQARQPEQIRSLLAAGADDYLTDLDDTERLDLRLAVAEHRLDGGDGCRSGQEPASHLPINSCPVLRGAPFGVFRAGIDGRFLDVNPALVNMLGYDSREELLSVDVPRDVYQDPADCRRAIAELTDHGHLEEAEFGWRRKDGTPIIVLQSGRTVTDDTGAVVQIQGMVYDVTEQRRTEEALRESEERFRAVFENAVDGLALADAETKRLHMGNPAFCRMLGYSREEIGSLRVEDLHPEEALPYALQHFESQIGREHILAKDIRVKRKDGSTFYADISSFPITSAGRVYLAGVFRDVTARKRAEGALRESEERYRQLVEFSPVGVGVAVQGTVRFVNPAAAGLFGASSPEELIGKPVTDFLHPDYRDQTLKRVQKAIEENRRIPPTERMLLQLDGTGIDLEVEASPITYQGEPAVQVVFHDIRQRKRAEEALRQSEQRLRNVLENMPVMLDAFDADGNIVAWNQECERLTGYRAEEIIGNPNAMQLLYPDDAYRQRMLEQWHLRGDDYRGWEWEITCKDGSTKTIAWSNISEHFPVAEWATWGVGVDVTERNRAIGQLRESEYHYRLIADNVGDMIWIGRFEGPADPANRPEDGDLADMAGQLMRQWEFTYVSPAIERLLGYDAQEAISLEFKDLLPPDSYAEAQRALSEELAAERQEPGQRRERTLELQHRAKDGSIRWVEVTTTFWRDRESRPIGLLGVTRDVTRRKEAERALRKSEGKLRTLFENLPDVVMTVDRNAVIQFVNHGTPGASPEVLVGALGLSFIVPEHQGRCRAAFQRACATGQPQTVDALDVFGCLWACRLVPMAEEDEVQNVMVICSDVTEREKAADAIRKEQQLLRQLLDLHERDRQLIAYEVHDGFTQYLTGALYSLEAAGRLQAQNPAKAQETFDAGLRLIQRGIQEARRLISGLRPPILDESGIVAAIDFLACETEERGEAEVEFIHDVEFQRLAAPLESAIFRIVQESLTNACRHSQSQKICIELAQQDDHVRVSVRDWGVGFNPEKVEEGRFGLRGIRERARLLGGRATIETAPDQGTRVTVELPLVEAAYKATDT